MSSLYELKDLYRLTGRNEVQSYSKLQSHFDFAFLHIVFKGFRGSQWVNKTYQRTFDQNLNHALFRRLFCTSLSEEIMRSVRIVRIVRHRIVRLLTQLEFCSARRTNFGNFKSR